MILERAKKSSAAGFLVPGILLGALFFAAAVWAYSASGDARFCGSCHSMKTVYTRWQTSNHGQFTCTECHLPDSHIAGKITYKTRAGLNDLIHETARDYGAGIGLSANNQSIIVDNCLRCHASTVAGTRMTGERTDCLKCHRYLVHGRGQDEGGIRIEK